MRRGRPLRFLAVVLGGWTAMRVVLLMPDAASMIQLTPAAANAAVRPVSASSLRLDHEGSPMTSSLPVMFAGRHERHGPVFPGDSAQPAVEVHNGSVAPVALASAPGTASYNPAGAQAPTIPSPTAPLPIARGPSRLAGSVWLIARGGANRDPLAGQLGGSQAGARLTYAIDRGRRLALSARVAGPLGGGDRGTEAGLGLDWQPTRAPLHLIAEQRVPLDGGRGGPALLAVGGIGPTAISPRLKVEAYAQGGVVVRDRAEGFGDGAARLTTSVASAGAIRLDLGLGAWGGIQRGARRLDVGPTAGVAVPVVGRVIRLTLDWRERIAGNARPGSGPALSVGADF